MADVKNINDVVYTDYSIRVCTGVVKFCDLQCNSYLVQRSDDAAGSYITAVPLALGNTLEGNARDCETYRIGDYVLLAFMEPGYSSLIATAFIIARIPQMVSEYIDLPPYYKIKNKPTATQYNKQETDLMAETPELDAAYVLKSWGEERFGGDWSVETESVLLKVSEFYIRLLGGGAGITVNSVDSSITGHGLVENKFYATNTKLGTIAGDSAIIEETVPINPILYSDKELKEGKYDPNKELVSSRKITSGLAYGEIEYTLSETVKNNKINKTIYAKTENRRDGSHYLSSVRGFELSKSNSISGAIPTYQQSLVVDPDIKAKKDLDKDAERYPFDRVLRSDFWEEIESAFADEDNTYVRRPGDFADKDSVYPDPDGSPSEIPYFKGRAAVSFLDNGGIVLRDAWGSEIRLENGDVQISAARHFNYIAGADAIGIVGGVTSITSRKAINLGSYDGTLDIQVDKLNLDCSRFDAAINHVRADIGDLTASLKKVSIGASSVSVSVDATYQLVTHGDIRILGAGRATFSGKGSVLDCDNKIHIAGLGTILHGDLAISNSSYRIGEIQNIKIEIKPSSSNLSVNGLVIADTVNAVNSMTAGKGGFFDTVTVANPPRVKEGFGVNKAPINRPVINQKDTTGNELKYQVERGGLTEEAGKDLLSSMFNLIGIDNYIVVPKFNKQRYNTKILGEIPSVDVSEKSKYIYPGEVFWNKRGLSFVVNAKDAKSIREEKVEETPSVGAKELCLTR